MNNSKHTAVTQSSLPLRTQHHAPKGLQTAVSPLHEKTGFSDKPVCSFLLGYCICNRIKQDSYWYCSWAFVQCYVWASFSTVSNHCIAKANARPAVQCQAQNSGTYRSFWLWSLYDKQTLQRGSFLFFFQKSCHILFAFLETPPAPNKHETLPASAPWRTTLLSLPGAITFLSTQFGSSSSWLRNCWILFRETLV